MTDDDNLVYTLLLVAFYISYHSQHPDKRALQYG